MAIARGRKRYRLGGEFVFRDRDGAEHRWPAGTELGPKAMANFDDRTIAAHVSTGMFQVIPTDRQGLAARVRSVIVRTT
jgi:hypothetical protein